MGGYSLEGITERTPFDEVAEREEYEDQGETVDLAGIAGIPRDALRTLLNFIIRPGGRAICWPSATKRLLCLASQAGVEEIAEHSLAWHSERLGFTRAALSFHAVRIADELGQAQSRGGKSKAAREKYREASIESHRRRGNRIHGHQSDVSASDADDELACVDPTGTR